jgi:hypothetical protein
VIDRLRPSNSDRSALEVGDAVDAVLGEQFEAPDMDAGQNRDLSAAIERDNERAGEVQGEVDLSGRDRLVQKGRSNGADIVDLRDAFVREQFVDDILRSDAEARPLGEPDPRRLGR